MKFNRIVTKSTLVLLAGVGVLSAASLTNPNAAHAQASQSTPRSAETRVVVVTTDNAAMRAGSTLAHYSVQTLKSGTTLIVDGEEGNFLRVRYLPGMRAFVRPDEGTLDRQAQTLRLTTGTKLLAANIAGGERGNWWPLLDQNLPEGTVLNVLQTLTNEAGSVYGHLVEAPASSRGWVAKDHVRNATPEEAAAARPATETPRQPTQTQRPAETRPESSPPTPVIETPTQETARTPTADPAAPAPQQVGPRVDPDNPLARAMGTVEALQSLYEQVQQQPIQSAEIDPVISEFQRKINSLGQSTDERRIARFLTARLEVLRLRKELQDSIRTAGESEAALAARSQEVADLVSEIERSAAYNLVGRLVISTVYDGHRLPLMYRIESADVSAPRTIGYVVPREGVDLLTKVGQVVGIVGEARFDEALRLNIVSARRVDTLTPARTMPAPAEVATPGETPGD